MPELPEVETVRLGVDRLAVGRVLAPADVIEPKSFRGDPSVLETRHVIGTRRHGKVLVIDLEGGFSLVAHLKMTGQLVWRGARGGPAAERPSADGSPIGDQPGSSAERWGAGHPNGSLVGDLPDSTTRVVLHFEDGSALYFNDQRKFGWLALMPTDQVEQIPLIAKMGPEPLEGDPWPEFRRRIRRHRNTSVKAAILNQEVVAGIGNIYADEACWAARVHPAAKVGDVTDRKLRAVLDGATQAMETSLKMGGSTDRNYVDAEGRRGAYLDFANVFRREGLPCKRCGRAIVKSRVAGRGTHTCPRCQRAPRDHRA